MFLLSKFVIIFEIILFCKSICVKNEVDGDHEMYPRYQKKPIFYMNLMQLGKFCTKPHDMDYLPTDVLLPTATQTSVFLTLKRLDTIEFKTDERECQYFDIHFLKKIKILFALREIPHDFLDVNITPECARICFGDNTARDVRLKLPDLKMLCVNNIIFLPLEDQEEWQLSRVIDVNRELYELNPSKKDSDSEIAAKLEKFESQLPLYLEAFKKGGLDARSMETDCRSMIENNKNVGRKEESEAHTILTDSNNSGNKEQDDYIVGTIPLEYDGDSKSSQPVDIEYRPDFDSNCPKISDKDHQTAVFHVIRIQHSVMDSTIAHLSLDELQDYRKISDSDIKYIKKSLCEYQRYDYLKELIEKGKKNDKVKRMRQCWTEICGEYGDLDILAIDEVDNEGENGKVEGHLDKNWLLVKDIPALIASKGLFYPDYRNESDISSYPQNMSATVKGEVHKASSDTCQIEKTYDFLEKLPFPLKRMTCIEVLLMLQDNCTKKRTKVDDKNEDDKNKRDSKDIILDLLDVIIIAALFVATMFFLIVLFLRRKCQCKKRRSDDLEMSLI